MPLKIEQDYNYAGDDYWRWSVWLEGSDWELDQVQSVTYNLHPTFKNPVRVVESRSDKFRLKAAGWGVFTLYANVLRKDGSKERLSHYLQLRYPDGANTTA
jgi:transcription initiation factor IIF auxiliary subunit